MIAGGFTCQRYGFNVGADKFSLLTIENGKNKHYAPIGMDIDFPKPKISLRQAARLLYIEFIFLQEDTSDTLNKPFRSDSPPLGPFFMERLVQKSLRYYIPRFADYKFRNRLWLCLISQSFKLRKHTLAPVVSCHAGKISKHSEQMCAKYRTRSLFNFKNNCDEWLQQEKRLKNYQFPKISERKNAVTYGNGP